MSTETPTDRLVTVLRETLHESGHDVSEQTARYVLGNLLAVQNNPGPCPTDPSCVLAADQHDDWKHADAGGNEWPVMQRGDDVSTETDARFVVALVKGAVEGDDSAHFGSLLGIRSHRARAVAMGLTDKAGEPTPTGRAFYDWHGLRDLPAGRAYLWPLSEQLSSALTELTTIPNDDSHENASDTPREDQP